MKIENLGFNKQMKTTNKEKQESKCDLQGVVCCAKCNKELSLEMIEEQKDEIEMELDALCMEHWEDDRLYMGDLVMY